MSMITFAIIKERKSPPDSRVPLTPSQCVQMQELHPMARILVESSDVRIFRDEDYRALGLEVTDDISQADVMLGVKEVPVEALVPHKTYLFFSHTIKKQPYNRKLLKALLEKNINLIDHETLVYSDGSRVLGFGFYAGLVGAYNGIRAWGLKHRTYEIAKAHLLSNLKALHQELSGIKLPAIKILLTGHGRVGKGAASILEQMNIRKVNVTDYLSQNFDEAVYCHVGSLDYNARKDGVPSSREDFYHHPEDYCSTFGRFSSVTDFFIAGHFHNQKAPFLFTREEAKSKDFKISVVADVSCDIDGPVACTIRPSTILNPLYGYDPMTEQEVDFDQPHAIAVMAVDNLPCELPRDASHGFGSDLLTKVIPNFFNDDADGILHRAQITQGGKLTDKFKYLQEYVDKA